MDYYSDCTTQNGEKEKPPFYGDFYCNFVYFFNKLSY